MNLYCAHCWRSGAPQPAVTIYHGDALCESHMREVRIQELERKEHVAAFVDGMLDGIPLRTPPRGEEEL